MDITEIFKEHSITGDNKADVLGLKVLCSSIIRSESVHKIKGKPKMIPKTRTEKPGPQISKRPWKDIVTLSQAFADRKVQTSCLPTSAAIEMRKRFEMDIETTIMTPFMVCILASNSSIIIS